MSKDKRAHSRFNFNHQGIIKLQRINQKVIEIYSVIDLSQGGLSFWGKEGTAFVINEELIILEIDGKVLEEALMAQVRYLDEVNPIGRFKVGLEFIKKLR